MSRYDDINSNDRTTIRWVRRRDEPSAPLWPSAFWPLLGILALTLFSCAHIQEQTEAAAERALTNADLNWAEANASGRTIYLTGEAPSQNAADRAKRVVESVDAGNWLGARLVPAPVRVHGDFTFASSAPTDAEPANVTDTSDPEPTPETQPEARPNGVKSPDWNFRLSGGVLELNGEMPTEALRQNVVQLATSSINPPRFSAVEDNLTVSNVRVQSGYFASARRGVETVTQCDQGVASFINRRFSLDCQLPADAIQRVRTRALAPLPFGTVGPISTQSSESVSACESSLRSRLSETRVQFASKSAVIDDASEPLITSIADIAKSCPGRLRIEGHTDSTGRDAENQELSLARAEAVRAALVEKGVAPARLIARGFGPRKPIADNSTREGRARNRRIEIKVVRPDE